MWLYLCVVRTQQRAVGMRYPAPWIPRNAAEPLPNYRQRGGSTGRDPRPTSRGAGPRFDWGPPADVPDGWPLMHIIKGTAKHNDAKCDSKWWLWSVSIFGCAAIIGSLWNWFQGKSVLVEHSHHPLCKGSGAANLLWSLVASKMFIWRFKCLCFFFFFALKVF